MALGLCCQYIEPIKKRDQSVTYKNIVGEKSLQYGKFKQNKYSFKDIENVWINNVKCLFNILTKIKAEGYSVFRVSSSLLPLFDELPDQLHNSTLTLKYLNKIGEFVKSNNIRLTTHPDQFVVLSSNSEDVINKSIKILEHHAWVFDAMNLDKTPYYSINIHGGKRGNINVLLNSISKLSDSVRLRLTFENDEIAYSVNDLLPVFNEYKIPICFDSHHHIFNMSNLSLDDAFYTSIETWGNVKPLNHLANTEPQFKDGSFMERRKHSNYVHYIPEIQKDYNNNDLIDIDFEFKMKNLAIKDAIKKFNIKL